MRILVVLFGVAFVLSVLPAIWFLFEAYRKYRGRGVLTCPETLAPVAVELDAARAALGELSGSTDLRLRSCSRWPERQDCGQECLQAVEDSPEDCLVRTILTKWYRGASCRLCGREFGTIGWSDHRPALLAPDRKTREWDEVPAEELEGVLKTHGPVCWDCHMAEWFRAAHPELVLDDPLHRAPRRAGVS